MSNSKFWFLPLACALSWNGLLAQGTYLSGPVSGLVFDSRANAIRPILGVPGASYLGNPMVEGLEYGAVAPNRKVALGVHDGRLYRIGGLETGELSWLALEGGLAHPGRIAWNSDSTAAALYEARSGRLQVWRGLGGEQPQGRDLENLSGLGAEVSVLVLNRAADSVVFGVGGDQGGVYLAPADGGLKLVARVGNPSAFAFSADETTLYVADRLRSEVIEVRDFAGSPDVLLFANESRGVSDPVGLAWSTIGKGLMVASGAGRSITFLDPNSATWSRMEVDFEISRLEPLSGEPLYLLTAAGGVEPLQILRGGLNPGIFFVPSGTAVAAATNPVEE